MTDNDNENKIFDGKDHRIMFWKSGKDFALAQVQVAVILGIAYIGNNWSSTYPRNDNHDPRMFWAMNGALAVAALITLKHDPNAADRGVQLLSRPQTEEFKGWMQWAFVMYHYYRVFYVYNEIRLFVSAYVWMTGFGNFLYFDKKGDFSLDRMIGMWIRINYFPLLLSLALSVRLDLYYVVPLHTVGFFVTMATCYIASIFKARGISYWTANGLAIALSLAVHIAFYETPMVNSLKFFSDEYFFRFQADKYSAWVGILCALFWNKFSGYMQWAYASEPQLLAMWLQRAGGAFLIFIWYYGFGFMSDKYMYNPVHPYIFWIPIAGWLMIRNSSKYLCCLHSEALEFLGKITLETYVLQFHVLMCKNVQHIPIVLPGAGPEGPLWLKTANMLLCGCLYIPLALWARKVTVTTQTAIVDLIHDLRNPTTSDTLVKEETVAFIKEETPAGTSSSQIV